MSTHSHTEEPRSVVLEIEVLIRKCFCAVDGGAASAVAIEEISTLNHEVFDLRTLRLHAFPRL